MIFYSCGTCKLDIHKQNWQIRSLFIISCKFQLKVDSRFKDYTKKSLKLLDKILKENIPGYGYAQVCKKQKQ